MKKHRPVSENAVKKSFGQAKFRSSFFKFVEASATALDQCDLLKQVDQNFKTAFDLSRR